MKIKTLEEILSEIEEKLKIDISSDNLDDIYTQIKKYITSIHPDNFTDEEIKKQNTEKTQVATEILSEIKKIKESTTVPETGITVVNNEKSLIENKEYCIFVKENELLQLKEKNREYKLEIERLKKEIEKLKDKIIAFEKNKTESKTKELLEKEKPKKRNYIIAGSSITLIIIYNATMQIEKISNKILQYLPVNRNIFNIIMFIVLILSILVILFKNIKTNYISSFLNGITVQTNISNLNDIIENGKINRQQIFDYVNKLAKEKNKILVRLFGLDNKLLIENGTNIIVDYLISEELIDKLNSERLVPTYKLKELSVYDLMRY